MRTIPLGELVTIKGGGTPDKSVSAYWDGPIPWASVKDFKSIEITKTTDTITMDGVNNSATNIIPAGAILVPTRMAVGKAAINTIDLAINQDIKALFPKLNLYTRYLLHILLANSSKLEDQPSGATVKGITLDTLKAIEIPLPPLDEQKRIAAILDQADELRRLRQRAINRLNELGQAIFYEMFIEGESQSWPLKKVADVAVQTRTGPFGSQLLHSEFVDSGIAVLGIDNAVQNEFHWGGQRFITSEKYRQLQRYTVHPDDVLITIMGTCGRCAIVPEGIPTSINTKHLCCIALDKLQMLPHFLHAAFLQHPAILNQLGSQAKGAVMPGLNMGIIRALEIRVPPLQL